MSKNGKKIEDEFISKILNETFESLGPASGPDCSSSDLARYFAKRNVKNELITYLSKLEVKYEKVELNRKNHCFQYWINKDERVDFPSNWSIFNLNMWANRYIVLRKENDSEKLIQILNQLLTINVGQYCIVHCDDSCLIIPIDQNPKFHIFHNYLDQFLSENKNGVVCK